MPLRLSELPYGIAALEPHISARTMEFHYGKHHKAYIDSTNAAIKGTQLDRADLETVVRTANANGDSRLFNSSAQAWNHEFFWRSMAPDAVPPSGRLLEYINRDFGGLEPLKNAFKNESITHFASGWTWLILRDGKLQVTSYHDADTPLIHVGVAPLLTADVWEHAYYLDYQNARATFVENFLNHLANWQGVNERLDAGLVSARQIP
jgi:Fe-Mn family superoxide dismutase